LPDRLLLQDLSFDLLPGSLVGLVGATGSGKTSLLRLLNRLIEPTSGQLFWHDCPYTEVPVLELRRQIGWVSAQPQLLGMKVRPALAYPLQLRGVPPRQQHDYVQPWLQHLRIPSAWLDQTEVQLSLGQRHWVTIARGLLQDPTVLLLDEPTAALDAHYRTLLADVLREWVQSPERAVIVASHDLSWVQSSCDRILYLQEGQLVQDCHGDQLDWEALAWRMQASVQALDVDWD
jgi:D-methionine transport system ATP-binding protein